MPEGGEAQRHCDHDHGEEAEERGAALDARGVEVTVAARSAMTLGVLVAVERSPRARNLFLVRLLGLLRRTLGGLCRGGAFGRARLVVLGADDEEIVERGVGRVRAGVAPCAVALVFGLVGVVARAH